VNQTNGSRRSYVLFCAAAMLSLVASITLWFSGYKEQGVYVGLWVPSILSLGAFLLVARQVN